MRPTAIVLCLAGIGGCRVAAADDIDNKPPDAGVKTPVRIDKAHPIIIYEHQYPEQSKVRGEQGSCAVRMEVDSDGVVRARQLVISTGFARLDVACVDAFKDARMLPATLDGKPVASWIIRPATWALTRGNNAPLQIRHLTDDELEVPIIQQDYDLKVGANFYPAEARAM